MANKLKERLDAGKACVNGWLAIPSGYSAEVMAACGWDAVTVDMQHGVQDYQSMVQCFQAMDKHPITPLVRVPWNEPGIIGKCLDGGAWGIISPMCNNGAEAMVLWKSDPGLDAPDLQIAVAELSLTSAANADKYDVPEHGWTACTAVLRPKSRGQIRLTGPDPDDRVLIEENMLSHDDDVVAAMACVELSREIGNSAPLRRFTKGEALPGDLRRTELERFVRDAAECYYHQSCTAKMGRDDMSVVDADLKVYGVEGLRVADASIMPRITTGNTMAPCVVIGERASDVLKREHGL